MVVGCGQKRDLGAMGGMEGGQEGHSYLETAPTIQPSDAGASPSKPGTCPRFIPKSMGAWQSRNGVLRPDADPCTLSESSLSHPRLMAPVPPSAYSVTPWEISFLDPLRQSRNALIILNQPFTYPLLRRVWYSSSWHACADGGANRLHDLLKDCDGKDLRHL